MKRFNKILKVQLFPILLGLIDGVLTVLVLATGHVLRGGDPLTFLLTLKLSFAASFSGVGVYFFFQYSQLRHRLIRAERELNLVSHGHFATTNLGKRVLREAIIGTVISFFFNFLGAMIPLVVAVLFPKISWISILIALLFLFILGILLSRMVYGSAVKWIIALVLTGIIVGYVGFKLNVV